MWIELISSYKPNTSKPPLIAVIYSCKASSSKAAESVPALMQMNLLMD